MPIVKPDKVIDVNVVLGVLRPADPDDNERIHELAMEAERFSSAAVYEARIVEAIDGDSVTISGDRVTIGGDSVTIGGDSTARSVTFHARPLSRLFQSGMTVYPYVATCGPGMAAYGESLTDPLEKYWWDIIMQNAVANARKALFDEIGRIAGYTPVSANPGSIELWPITNQPALFSLIGDVEKLIGVVVTPSFLMRPLKSVSGIMFRGDGGFTHNCNLCDRANCEGRAAEFDAKLKAELEMSSL